MTGFILSLKYTIGELLDIFSKTFIDKDFPIKGR